MAKKITGFKTRGMNKDLSVSAFNPEFAFENMNLRLSTNEGNTLMSWVNERGTAPISLAKGKWHESDTSDTATVTSIEGIAIGTAVINNVLVLFTHADNKDCIYKLKYHQDDKSKMMGILLYSNNLGFSLDNPLETLVSYEAETVQKVYWVDGINQPRVINIEGDYSEKPSFIFDFVPELQLKEKVTILKEVGANGMFAPGVIQYALTYYNRYGQESNVFYTSPLLYISYSDRGASPEDKVDNAFRITVSNIDQNFDYLRIYSIQRTSINGTPICKRIQDIEIKKSASEVSASYIDTGTTGDAIDPTELLYKGGEVITASTIEQKDNTLFLGNISITRERVDKSKVTGSQDKTGSQIRSFTPSSVSTKNYIYGNQLSAIAGNESVPCAGFKRGDYYRCGIQFQHKSGKWSDPIHLGDWQVTGKPAENSETISIPIIKGNATISDSIIEAGYVRYRPVVVYPRPLDRVTICQGVGNPTLFTVEGTVDKGKAPTQVQSSWFFRPKLVTNSDFVSTLGTVVPCDEATTSTRAEYLEYTDYKEEYNPKNIRRVEIQGEYNLEKKYSITDTILTTLHSPDIEFDTDIAVTDFNNVGKRVVGAVDFTCTMSDISIQTETPVIKTSSGGFIHKSFVMPKNDADGNGSSGIVSGLFYDDFLVDDMGDGSTFRNFEAYSREKSPVKWMVYLWNKEGSLNNDCVRASDKGVATAVLKKKVVSNLRITDTGWAGSITEHPFNSFPQATVKLFSSDDPTIIKIDNCIYQGNVDKMLVPDRADGMYFALGNKEDTAIEEAFINTDFYKPTKEYWYKTGAKDEYNIDSGYGLWKYKSGTPSKFNLLSTYNVGKYYIDLIMKKEPVRMKYKSSPHLVGLSLYGNSRGAVNTLPIVEIVRNVDINTIFGGKSDDAKRENIWIPCGKSEEIPSSTNSEGTIELDLSYEWGDTYFQRYDCLKTYAFTPEDTNQVVEIGSFMLETHVNIDGRYDKNRGQLNNLNMSPRNFNLLNPVYSQINNFFSYRIQDDSYYENTVFPNQLTWSKTKTAGADVDQWTNVTLASVLDLDGDKGKLNKLIRFNNYLFAFQDTGISQILYNDNVQISATDGVPIEIANSGKVQGKDYKSDTIGCSNKWSMTTTPNGIYFMDSHDKSIYLFNGQLQNISNMGGFSSWSKKNIHLTKNGWNPLFTGDAESEFVTYFDKLNQDVLFINKGKALAWSEKLQAFTSFYDYGEIPFFCNLDDTGIWIQDIDDIIYHGGDPDHEPWDEEIKETRLWKHQGGESYCNFFGNQYPYWMTLIGNPEPQTDKIFTNLEFRACVDGDGTVDPDTGKFTPSLPFDTLETWNEYQHGIANIINRNGHDLYKHHSRDITDIDSSLIRKFRTWRCDIPRSNASLSLDDPEMNIYRKDIRPQDRMRNPWLYLKLMKNANSNEGSSHRTEIHDIIMTYYS